MDSHIIDIEVLDMFKDQFESQVPNIEPNIIKLEKVDTYKDAVDDLFRFFHSYKATTSYLHLDSMLELIVQCENVLSSLKNSPPPADESIVEWLLKVNDQFVVWLDEVRDDLVTFTEAPKSLVDGIKVTNVKKKPSEILAELDLVYVDKNLESGSKITSALSKIVKHAQHIQEINDVYLSCSDIIILNDEKAVEHFNKIQEQCKLSAIIVVKAYKDKKDLVNFAKQGINHILNSPIRGEELKRELFAVVTSHFSQRRVLITNKKIAKFIDQLEPLPNSILQIQQICDDDELSVKDLIKVVKSDPLVTGTILNAAQSPIYSLKAINTIDQAVSIFGKKTVKALTLDVLKNSLGEIDLSSYGIDEYIFSEVSSKRLALMVKWYSKVSVASLSILSSSAILGNIGQILLSKEVNLSNKKDDFCELLKNQGVRIAEETFFHTTTALVSSDILSYWKLNNDIVDSIRYSDEPENAPVEIKELCVANYIVYNLVDTLGNIKSELDDEIYYFLSTENLDPAPLIKALDSINSL